MADPRPRLNTLIFEVTQRCNHSCLHCYNVWQPDDEVWPSDYPRGQLDTDRTLALLNKALDETRTAVAVDHMHLVADLQLAVSFARPGCLILTHRPPTPPAMP